MPKIEMEIIVKPGEIKELVGDDGAVTIKGEHDPEIVAILQELDKACILHRLGTIYGQPPYPFGPIYQKMTNLSPRLRKLLKENPLA